jgi:hypothetical protein
MQHNQLSIGEHAEFHYNRYRRGRLYRVIAGGNGWQDGGIVARLAEKAKILCHKQRSALADGA